MSRKRSHHTRRFPPATERSYHEYLSSVPAPNTSRAELIRLIRGGEDTYLELKVKFSNVEKLTAEIIALANTDGGTLIFGVNDQLRIEGVDDPEQIESDLREICSQHIQPSVFPYLKKVAFDNGRRIVILEIEAHRRPHHTKNFQFFVRDGSSKREATREELSTIYGESPFVRFEQNPLFKARLSDVDEALFWSFVRGICPDDWADNDKGFPTAQMMFDLGLAAKINDQIIITLGGILLFGKHEKVVSLLPQAAITLTRFGGNKNTSPIIEQTVLQGNLLRLYDGSMNFIKRYVDLWEMRPSRKALTEEEQQFSRTNYHREAVIEALTNSIIHRDWSVTDKSARINIYDDSLEIINPSREPELPLHSLRYGISQPPNPRLKTVFTNRHYGLKLTHGGVPMIFDAATIFAKRAPENLSLNNYELRLKIYGWK